MKVKQMLLQALTISVIMSTYTVSHAYTVDLKENVFDVKGQGAKREIVITNDEDKTVAVEVTAYKRNMDEFGNSSEISLQEDLFLIYPNQLILKPGQEKFVNIIYIGPSMLEKEEAYRFEIAEISLENQEEKEENDSFASAEIVFLTRYLKSVYVKPKNTIAKPSLSSSEFISSGNKKYAKIKITNNGTAHSLMKGLKFKITKKTTATQTDKSIAPFKYTSPLNVVILPKKSRQFLIELPETFNDAVGIRVKYTVKANE